MAAAEPPLRPFGRQPIGRRSAALQRGMGESTRGRGPLPQAQAQRCPRRYSAATGAPTAGDRGKGAQAGPSPEGGAAGGAQRSRTVGRRPLPSRGRGDKAVRPAGRAAASDQTYAERASEGVGGTPPNTTERTRAQASKSRGRAVVPVASRSAGRPAAAYAAPRGRYARRRQTNRAGPRRPSRAKNQNAAHQAENRERRTKTRRGRNTGHLPEAGTPSGPHRGGHHR